MGQVYNSFYEEILALEENECLKDKFMLFSIYNNYMTAEISGFAKTVNDSGVNLFTYMVDNEEAPKGSYQFFVEFMDALESTFPDELLVQYHERFKERLPMIIFDSRALVNMIDSYEKLDFTEKCTFIAAFGEMFYAIHKYLKSLFGSEIYELAKEELLGLTKKYIDNYLDYRGISTDLDGEFSRIITFCSYCIRNFLYNSYNKGIIGLDKIIDEELLAKIEGTNDIEKRMIVNLLFSAIYKCGYLKIDIFALLNELNINIEDVNANSILNIINIVQKSLNCYWKTENLEEKLER
jgi:hypothetical protein